MSNHLFMSSALAIVRSVEMVMFMVGSDVLVEWLLLKLCCV